MPFVDGSREKGGHADNPTARIGHPRRQPMPPSLPPSVLPVTPLCSPIFQRRRSLRSCRKGKTRELEWNAGNGTLRVQKEENSAKECNKENMKHQQTERNLGETHRVRMQK
eukprot:RCo023919